MPEPLFYTKNRRVFQRPVTKTKDDGTCATSMGFAILDVLDGIDAEGVQFIVDALNAAEKPDA